MFRQLFLNFTHKSLKYLKAYFCEDENSKQIGNFCLKQMCHLEKDLVAVTAYAILYLFLYYLRHSEVKNFPRLEFYPL